MSKKIGTCKHCLRENIPLQKKSHIISKFLFQEILAEPGSEGRVVKVDPKTLDKKGKAQDAPYEKYIYCVECENTWSAIETEASKILYHYDYDPNKITKTSGEISDHFYYQEADILVFKKFLLLNLLRAHYSSHYICATVSLGMYKDIFRRILLEEISLDKSNCSFHIFNFRQHIPYKFRRFATHFNKIKLHQRNGYSIYIDGIGYYYHFGEHINPLLDATNIDNPNGLAVNVLNKQASRIAIQSIFQIEYNIIH